MSNGRKFLFMLSFLIIDILLIGFIVLMRDITIKNELKKEINVLMRMDFNKDSYDTNVKFNGEYANVEKAIKEYLDNYSTDVQIIYNIKNDEKLNNMLSITNYKEDGPLFVQSLDYLQTIRNKLNYNVDLLMESVNEKEVNQYIYNYSSDDESVELYYNLLLESNLFDKIIDNQVLVESERIEINGYIDSIYDILIFLRNNSDTYIIGDDNIIFNDMIVKKQYYDLINKIKRISK